LRGIFPHGILLWHEGITPEYKGLYSPFWAVHNVDFDRIGYTLLRVSDELDAGEPFAQGPAVDIDPLRHSHQYIGHKAIADSLEAVARVLRDFHEGAARPLQRKGAPAGYYTYPGLSDLIRQRIRLWRWQRQSRSAAVPQPNGAGSLFRPTSYQFENTFSEKDSRPLDV
jgi:methionyl-tRNA formyltransferase